MPNPIPGIAKAYAAWRHMRKRCDDPNNPAYHNYGGRGITYDPSWKSFYIFLKDMGQSPEGLMLERKDNEGNYCKDNCCWATRSEQMSNRRLFSNNVSGLAGVSWDTVRSKWIAYGHSKGGRGSTRLYYGNDFFEACCARKSWEANKRRAACLVA